MEKNNCFFIDLLRGRDGSWRRNPIRRRRVEKKYEGFYFDHFLSLHTSENNKKYQIIISLINHPVWKMKKNSYEGENNP